MRASLFTDDAPPYTRFARVAIERSHDHPDGLTYGLPAALADIRTGERVEVPLGVTNKPVGACVIEISDNPAGAPIDRIKPLLRRTGVGIPPSLVALGVWMARYYCCPLGMVFASLVPAAVKQAVGETERVELEPTGAQPDDTLPPTARRAWDSIQALDPAPAWPIDARSLSDLLDERTLAPVNRLIRAGVLREVRTRRVRALWQDVAPTEDRRVELTPEQSRAARAITDSLGAFRSFVLRGVTGSGKTEVYLQALEAVLDRDERVIVLVPEISLTPQTMGRFLARLASRPDARVAILHSGLTAAQRNEQWSLVASGRANVVLGARSAVFAPFPEGPRVGLIIVDEEHDDGYKQDQTPRYNGRDVAIKRAQIENCPILLGSATPSLESWRNAVEGRHTLLELPARVGGAVLPRVEIVDLADERRARPWTDREVHLLGPRLEHAIEKTLASGGQAALLLNRRGFGNYICCPDHRCGWVLSCDDCDATMVYHRDRLLPAGGVVRCHHCLAERLLPHHCPVCNRRVSVFGMGTQRVEAELSRRFPELIPGETLVRADSDTTRSFKDWMDLLDRFRRGEARVLLGTQMIAKGHDFPNLRLVGVVNADTAINLPDFRAAERTFQLVTQVAGRAGRPGAKDPGLVIVQTFTPSAAPIQHAAAHDYRAFADEELAHRKRAGLPPCTRMARIVVRHKTFAKAEEVAARIRDVLESAPDAGPCSLRGPMPCPISRIAGQYRLAIELTAHSASAIQARMTHARNLALLKSDATTAVDVDPIALL